MLFDITKIYEQKLAVLKKKYTTLKMNSSFEYANLNNSTEFTEEEQKVINQKSVFRERKNSYENSKVKLAKGIKDF